MEEINPSVKYEGWLYKWTNYVNGYQKRWFVLAEGLISYYRNQGEMAHSCRGTISLKTAQIKRSDSYAFIIKNKGTQTLYIKAPTKNDCAKWMSAFESARCSINSSDEKSQESISDDDSVMTDDNTEQPGEPIVKIGAKLDDLNNFRDSIYHNSEILLDLIAQATENNFTSPENKHLLISLHHEVQNNKQITSEVISSCQSMKQFLQESSSKWSRALERERRKRAVLQQTMEQLTNQYARLEHKIFIQNSNKADCDDNNNYEDNEAHGSDEEYHDAKDAEVPPATNNKQKPQQQQLHRVRRTRIPPKPNSRLNVWDFVKNFIGKELTRIPLPVYFSEPLSLLQRLTEELAFSSLLDQAECAENQWLQLSLLAVFTITAYSYTPLRLAKPFNPLLGETFEFDRSDDLGWRSLSEQVSHHPPAAALHAEGNAGWQLWQDFCLKSKLKATHLFAEPMGVANIRFKSTGYHYTWRKAKSAIYYNFFSRKLSIDNFGEVPITNHTTGDTCILTYHEYSMFSRDRQYKVAGIVRDSNNTARYVVQGFWNEQLEVAEVISWPEGKDWPQTKPPVVVWRREPLPPGAEQMYNFTQLAIEMNEPEEGVCPTDSRFRPDQRFMELARWDEANAEKLKLEEEQRSRLKRRQAELYDVNKMENQDSSSESASTAELPENDSKEQHKPMWFSLLTDSDTGLKHYVYNGDYWERKKTGDWSGCPNLF